MSAGLRILALDGGGTRCLSTLYVLREIMNLIVPGQGGTVRPAEYFDIIGASGPNALAALLFVRFAFSIDEALDYCHEFASRMEKVDDIFRTKVGENMTDNDWAEIEEESTEPDVQIETVRREVLSNTWSELICRQVTDWLEVSKHKENGKFNFKSPGAHVGVGRCRAAAMSSEAPGFGADGGVDKNRMYHAPRWHRTYIRRNITDTPYTLYAVALGTCASPGIISNGLLFPELFAPGTHVKHNPVELLLEECGKLWPGLNANLILSIGAGKLALPDQWPQSNPYGRTCAEACLKISQDADKAAQHIEKYIIPHHRMYQNAYFRFNVSSNLPLFENEMKDEILAKALSYLEDERVATRAARVADLLEEDTFPSTWEDHVAVASLAFLSTTFASTGYSLEVEMVSDALSSYILYEPTRIDSGTHRKLTMATSANQLMGRIRKQIPWTRHTVQSCPLDFILNSLMAYGEAPDLFAEGYQGNESVQMNSLSDITAAIYYILIRVRSEGTNAVKSFLFTPTLRLVAPLVSMPPEVTTTLTARLEEVLAISSIASLCEAAYQEYLVSEPRMLLNGPFVRHLTSLLLETDLNKLSARLLDPITNAMSGILRLGKWSSIRDALIVRLLNSYSETKVNWALTNLAVEWKAQSLDNQGSEWTETTVECDRLCQKWMDECNQAFATHKPKVAILSVRQGYLGLLRKALEGHELRAPPRTAAMKPCATASPLLQSAVTETGENLLHLSAKSGFIPATKILVEALGTVQSKPFHIAKDSDGFCPLHLGCKRRGDVDSILLHVYGGASLDTVDLRGQTALHTLFPPRSEVQDYVPVFDKFASDHGLLLTLPLKSFQAWGIHGKGRTIGTDAFVLRRLIIQFVSRGASINVKDDQGRTPAHSAAANGWGINIDALFSKAGADAEEMIRECLVAVDNKGNDVLTITRNEFDDDAEAIISSEMRKRCLTVPRVTTLDDHVQDYIGKMPRSPQTRSPTQSTSGSSPVGQPPAPPFARESPPSQQSQRYIAVLQGPNVPSPTSQSSLPTSQASSRVVSPTPSSPRVIQPSPTSSRIVSPTPSSPRIVQPSQQSPPPSSYSSTSPPFNQPTQYVAQPPPPPTGQYPQGPQYPPMPYRPTSSDDTKKVGGKFLKKIFK